MTIQYAILGLLSWQPFSGYDLKKIISGSELFYWSGNNNQIYKALVQLHDGGLVTQQVQYQQSLPARKVYSITDRGREELRRWALSSAEVPEVRNSFLLHFAWSDLLTDEELDASLRRYEEEVEARLRMLQEKARRRTDMPARTPRESFLWDKVSENMTSTVQNELEWTRRVREELKEKRKIWEG